MTGDTWREFVLERARTAKVATVRENGRPHVTPVWIDLDGEVVVFTTGARSVKGRDLRRDPRVMICIDDDAPPFAFVLIERVADLSEDLDALRTWATRIGGRYMGADRAEEFGARNGTPGELLVRVRPTRVRGATGITD
jgi:PPOX class probable F420-dependent enzyme